MSVEVHSSAPTATGADLELLFFAEQRTRFEQTVDLLFNLAHRVFQAHLAPGYLAMK